jgi:hypothetical protein
MVLEYVLSVIMKQNTISYKEICYLVNRIWNSLLCFVDQTEDKSLTQLPIFIDNAYVFIQ